MPVKGELWLDSGAVAAVRQHRKSLFAAGILNIQGAFAAQDAVVLCDARGYEFARGLCNYTHQELLKVQVSRPVLTRGEGGKGEGGCVCEGFVQLHLPGAAQSASQCVVSDSQFMQLYVHIMLLTSCLSNKCTEHR